MDILCHTLTGTAVGTVIASYSKKSTFYKFGIILLGTLGGALPDLDAISLWSKFDSIFGAFLNLEHLGKEIYFGKLWYSHHSFLHSITAALGIPIIYFIVLSLIRFKRVDLYKTKNILTKYFSYILAFCLGFIFHLFEDMPTPHSVWGGVRLFFPSSQYYGGWGKIWWWNNYDLFLIILGTIVLNIVVLTTIKQQLKKYITTSIFVCASFLFIFQINNRNFDFNYKGHTPKYHEYEKQSKEIQKEILGDKVYRIMEKFDNYLQLNF